MHREHHTPAVPITSSTGQHPTSWQSNRSLSFELLKRIGQGDESALGELYDHTSPIIFGLILRIVGNRETAEEVTLDVYTQVWKHPGQYDAQRGTLLTWIMVLARSRAFHSLRSQKRRECNPGQPLETSAEFTDLASNPEEDSVENEQSHVIQTALALLNPEQRQAIELAFFSERSHREIAIRLGQPLGTVKTRILLGMLRLQDFLAPSTNAIRESKSSSTTH